MNEMEKYFENRTKAHIGRVQRNLRFLMSTFSELNKKVIVQRIRTHDKSKFVSPEREGYILITENYRPGSNFKPTDQQQRIMDKAWKHHQEVNLHHPENHRIVSRMSKEDLAEMVADHAAMSQELGDSLLDWEESFIKKHKFSDDQKGFILTLAKSFNLYTAKITAKIDTEVLEEEDFSGYLLRTEIVDTDFEDTKEKTVWKQAYAKDGSYIGDPAFARKWYNEYGIVPEAIPDHGVASIGFSAKDGKWYGWSHRAAVGFGVGDMVFEENFGNENTLFTKHGSKPIRSMKDAKQAAINFAKYVAAVEI